MENESTIRIGKDQLTKLHFDEVNSEHFPERNLNNIKRMLKVATNKTINPKKMTTVVFQSKNRGLFHVRASILMAGRDFVVFKGGQTLPIKSIVHVKA